MFLWDRVEIIFAIFFDKFQFLFPKIILSNNLCTEIMSDYTGSIVHSLTGVTHIFFDLKLFMNFLAGLI